MLALNGRADSHGLQIASKYAALSCNMSDINTNGTIMTPSTPNQGQFMERGHVHRHMWIVTGPAGCGKTTIAEFLAAELGLPYIEGDDVSITGGQLGSSYNCLFLPNHSILNILQT